MPSAMAGHWPLDPGITFLNHGSFGACPRPVLEAQQALRDRLEAQPVRFLARELPARLAEAREVLAAFIGADPNCLAFLPNATTAINTVLHSVGVRPADELLTTDHEYNATLNALRAAADRAGADVIVAEVPFPIPGPDAVVEAILERVTHRTRLAMVSHVTSPTALRFPIERLVAELAGRGIDTLVDGAHAPGMLPLDVTAIGAAWYAGDLHKWVCAPKGSAFLHARADRRDALHPLATSHGFNAPLRGRTRFRAEFDWVGTADPTPYLAAPTAIEFVGSLLDGGWRAVIAANRDLAVRGRELVLEAVGSPSPAPGDMLGSMAAVPLPDGLGPDVDPAAASPLDRDPLQAILHDRAAVEVPISPWPVPAAGSPHPPRRVLRISAHLYNAPDDYVRLAAALRDLHVAAR